MNNCPQGEYILTCRVSLYTGKNGKEYKLIEATYLKGSVFRETRACGLGRTHSRVETGRLDRQRVKKRLFQKESNLSKRILMHTDECGTLFTTPLPGAKLY